MFRKSLIVCDLGAIYRYSFPYSGGLQKFRYTGGLQKFRYTGGLQAIDLGLFRVRH